MVKTSDCGSDMHGFESHQAPHKKDFGFCQGLFYLSDEDENPFEGSSASELRLECFCDWTKSKKQNTELPLNANEQDNPIRRPIYIKLVVYIPAFVIET